MEKAESDNNDSFHGQKVLNCPPPETVSLIVPNAGAVLSLNIGLQPGSQAVEAT